MDGRLREAQAAADQSERWFAGAPTVTLSHRDDRAGRDTGFKERELGLAAPLWRLGQRQAAGELAAADAREAQAAAMALRLNLAGQVRELAWAAQVAAGVLDMAHARTQALAQLQGDVLRRVQSGDMARSDALLVRQDLLAAEAGWQQAQMDDRQARQRLHVVVGVENMPALDEPRIPADAPGLLAAAPRWEGIIDAHPNARAARAATERAQARLRHAELAIGDAAEVGINLRWQRNDALQPSDRALGLSVRVPLGRSPSSQIAMVAAQTEVDTMAAEERHVRYALELELRETQEALRGHQAIVAASVERARIAQERLALIQKAFQLGEQGLTERLRAEATASESRAQAAMDRAFLGRAHARHDQAQGLLP